MVDQNGAYTFQKRGIFYFSKRVPSDLREFYKVSRLTYPLKTKCPKLAKTKVRSCISSTRKGFQPKKNVLNISQIKAQK